MGHDRLSVYGIARDHGRVELHEILALLEDAGLVGHTTDRYRSLAVTPRGRDFLRRREPLTLSRVKSQDDDPSQPWPGLDQLEFDRGLFDQLRDLRFRLAQARNVPPYMVFGDRSLQEMACYLPHSRKSFSEISGVGRAKLKEFANDFLPVITDYAGSRGLAERPRPQRRIAAHRSTARKGSTQRQTLELVLSGLSISEVSRRRGLTEATIMSHVEHLIAAGETLPLERELPTPER